MAALGRALREDGREEGMRFHVRCARAGGDLDMKQLVGVLKVDGGTVGAGRKVCRNGVKTRSC